MGCDLVETTAHPGARPSHAERQGQVFSRSGRSPKYPTFERTGYGTGAGLCGWNCRHSFYPFFEGLSDRAYSRSYLDDINARDIDYRGKKYSRYESNQQQRALERRVRAFVQATGGRTDSARESVSGFGRSQASKAALPDS